jgi:hypothetical protein
LETPQNQARKCKNTEGVLVVKQTTQYKLVGDKEQIGIGSEEPPQLIGFNIYFNKNFDLLMSAERLNHVIFLLLNKIPDLTFLMVFG